MQAPTRPHPELQNLIQVHRTRRMGGAGQALSYFVSRRRKEKRGEEDLWPQTFRILLKYLWEEDAPHPPSNIMRGRALVTHLSPEPGGALPSFRNPLWLQRQMRTSSHKSPPWPKAIPAQHSAGRESLTLAESGGPAVGRWRPVESDVHFPKSPSLGIR